MSEKSFEQSKNQHRYFSEWNYLFIIKRKNIIAFDVYVCVNFVYHTHLHIPWCMMNIIVVVVVESNSNIKFHCKPMKKKWPHPFFSHTLQMLSNNCFNINQIFTLWSQFHFPHYVRFFFLLKDALGYIVNIAPVNFSKIKSLSYVLFRMHFQCTSTQYSCQNGVTFPLIDKRVFILFCAKCVGFSSSTYKLQYVSVEIH